MHDKAIPRRPSGGRGHPVGALPPLPLVSLLLVLALLAVAAGPVGARGLVRSVGDGEGLCAGDPDDGEHKIPVPTIVETPDPKYGFQNGVKSAAIDTPPAAAPVAAGGTLGACRGRSLLLELLASWRPLGLAAWAPTWLFVAPSVTAAAPNHR